MWRPASTVDVGFVLVAYGAMMLGLGGSIRAAALVLPAWVVAQLVFGRWTARAPSAIPPAMRIDVLLLLAAVALSPLTDAPIGAAPFVIVVSLGIGAVVAKTSLRGDRALHSAALFVSIFALLVAEEVSKVMLYSGTPATGGRPSPLEHTGFHSLLDAAAGANAVILLLAVAWIGVRRGATLLSAGYVIGSLPVVLTSVILFLAPIAAGQPHPADHPYHLIAITFWVLAAGALLIGSGATRLIRSPVDLSSSTPSA